MKAAIAALALVVTLGATGCGTTSPAATPASPAAGPDSAAAPAIPVASATTASPATPALLASPTGPAAIGVREAPSVSPDSAARLWYPAVSGTGNGQPPYASVEVAASYGLTPDTLANVRLQATLDATPAPAAEPRPGVVLMPGLGAPMALYTALAQDLASNGFVVLTIDPATANTGTANQAPVGRRDQLGDGVDYLSGPNVTPLAGPVDAARIAAGGHSLAGADAAQLSLTDDRIAAVFDLDGWLHGPALTTPLRVPALFVEASGFDPPTKEAIIRSTRAVTIELAGATHFDVTDAPCLAPALGPTAALLDLGPIGCTGSVAANALVSRFLHAVLRDRNPTPTAADLASGLDGLR